MNGADALISTLTVNEVTACFANPGTSEMQFVAALDRNPAMRPILCLFEGVATGAADGYGRVAGKPACTLLHLGPGYANGIANLHNARRAFTPIVNIIGDHATYHRQYDAPLNSDVFGLARPNSLWIQSADRADDVSRLTAEAIVASRIAPGGPVSLILPADSAWLETSAAPVIASKPVTASVDAKTVDAVAQALRKARKPVLLLGGEACRAPGLALAARIASTGVEVFSDTFVAFQSRGAGRFSPRRMPYYSEVARQALEGVDLMVLVGAARPVAFFAYPDRPSEMAPDGCEILTLAHRSEDAVGALHDLASALNAPKQGPVQSRQYAAAAPTGPLTAQGCGQSIGRHLPAGAIVCDDSATSGQAIAAPLLTGEPHDVLALTGGAIGIGMPLALGAAVAAPDRKVVVLTGDGAGMYSIQSIWSLVRENCDVCVVVFANRSYRILNLELARTGAGVAGPQAAKLLELTDPPLDWVSLARGMGMAAYRCDTGEAFDTAFAEAMRTPGPRLIEAVVQ